MNLDKNLLRLLQKNRLAFALTILTGFLGGIFTIAQAWEISQIVDRVFLLEASLEQVFPILLTLLGIIFFRALLLTLNEISAKEIALRIKAKLRERLFNHIADLGPSFTRQERTGELSAAAIEGIEALDAYYSQYLPQLILSALIPLSILFFIFPRDLLSGFILLVTAPLIPFFMILIGKTAAALTHRQYDTLSRLSAHFLDSLQGLTTLKTLGQSKKHAREIQATSEAFSDATMQVLRVTFLSALALELIATLSTAIIAVEIGLRLLYAHMAFQPAFFLLILAPEFYLPLRMLGLRFHAGMDGTAAARKIFSILEIETREKRVESSQFPQFFSTLSFSTLYYAYPNEERYALDNINLTLQRGRQYALIGVSGAGKSTLTQLLLGFITPTQGKILVDETPLDEISPDVWRKQIAWVPQKPHIFNTTIAENIRLGKPDAALDEVVDAAKAAQLHDWILTLPDGYETRVGEAGSRLSGGEAQRLALARAFLKDAPLLILDEPTSSLDPITEAALESSTRQLMQGRTTLIIAHRLNTVTQADEIIVLDEGQIVEQGTHAALLAKNGIYAKLVARDKEQEVGDKWQEASRKSQVASLQTEELQNHRKTEKPSDVQPLTLQPAPTFLRLLRFLRGSWREVALATLIGSGTIASSIALIGTSAWLIAKAALHPSIAALNVAIVGVRFFGISRGVFRYLERLISHRITFRLLARLRTWFYTAIEPLVPARLLYYQSGDLLGRVVNDVETLKNFYIRVVSPPLVAVVIALGCSAFLGVFAPRLGWTLFAFLLLLGMGISILAWMQGKRDGKAFVRERNALHTYLVDGIQGLSDLLAFGRLSAYRAEVASLGQAYAATQRKIVRVGALHSGLALLLTHLGVWSILTLAIPLVDTGALSGVMLGALTLIAFASFEAVQPLPLTAQMLEESLEAARRLFDIVDAEPEIVERGKWEMGSGKSQVTSGKGQGANIEFAGLSFAYEGETVLHDISFEIKPGQSFAVVGPSGAGKSTLAGLLLRFWDYEQGEIYFNGQPLKSYAADDLRAQMAVIPQRAYLFNTSLRENIRLARPNAIDAEVEEAAKRAGIHDFVMGLANGYDTFVGEQGVRLSGGERQRVAIARAILKDAPFLILDEPTAHLDVRTEQDVLSSLFGLMREKTALLITHRLVGLDAVDEILVLDRGKIVQRGTQTELRREAGLYRQLYQLQHQILPEE